MYISQLTAVSIMVGWLKTSWSQQMSSRFFSSYTTANYIETSQFIGFRSHCLSVSGGHYFPHEAVSCRRLDRPPSGEHSARIRDWTAHARRAGGGGGADRMCVSLSPSEAIRRPPAPLRPVGPVATPINTARPGPGALPRLCPAPAACEWPGASRHLIASLALMATS